MHPARLVTLIDNVMHVDGVSTGRKFDIGPGTPRNSAVFRGRRRGAKLGRPEADDPDLDDL